MQRLRISIVMILIVVAFVAVGTRLTMGQAARPTDLENLGDRNPFFIEAYRKAGILSAWEKLRGVSLFPVTVGVVDTGIERSHPEFTGIQLGSSLRFPIQDESDTRHGTAVTGIIAANNRSDEGVPYEDPQINGILSGALAETQYTVEVRNKRAAGSAFDSRLFVESVAFRGSKAVNISSGDCDAVFISTDTRCISHTDFLEESRKWREKFEKLQMRTPDALFVIAAGNWDFLTSAVTPANVGGDASLLTNIIVVGATDLNDARARFPSTVTPASQFGSGVDIAAPGLHVYAPKRFTAPLDDNDYYQPDISDPTRGFSGTSAAAPFVTGVAGLIKAVRSGLTPAQIKQILIETADPIQTGEPDKRLGTGCYSDPDDPVNTGCRLNAHRAVCHPLVLNCPPEGPLRAGFRVAVADNGDYLVVFPQAVTPTVEGAATYTRVAGVFFGPDGQQKGAPFTIADYSDIAAAEPRFSNGEVGDVDVAFGNGVFLVTWHRVALTTQPRPCNPAGGEQSDTNIYAARVLPNGTVLDNESMTINAAPWFTSSPRTAFDGAAFFIAWDDARNTAQGVTCVLNHDIWGRRVNASVLQIVVESEQRLVEPEALWRDQMLPQVACDASTHRCLVAFLDQEQSSQFVRVPDFFSGTPIQDGAVIPELRQRRLSDADPILPFASQAHVNTALVFRSGAFRLFSVFSLTPNTPSGAIVALRADSDGNVTRTFSFVGDLAERRPFYGLGADEDLDDNGIRLVWQEFDTSVGQARMFTALLNDDNVLLSGPNLIAATDTGMSFSALELARIACMPDRCLVVWIRLETPFLTPPPILESEILD